MNTQFHVSYIK